MVNTNQRDIGSERNHISGEERALVLVYYKKKSHVVLTRRSMTLILMLNSYHSFLIAKEELRDLSHCCTLGYR
jgi:hypothetical protein